MKEFCRYCGRELDGVEPRCPECGMPTTSFRQQQFYPPRRNNNTTIAIVVVSLIAVACIAGVMILPSLIFTSETYTVTITVESYSIDVADTTQYGGATEAQAYLELSADGKSVEIGHENCHLDGTDSHFVRNTATYRISTNDLENIKYTAFLKIKNGNSYDIIDIYKVDPSKIQSGSPEYLGCSGVTFTVSDYSGNSTITLEGDSDPIGNVVLRFSAVKN